ncbi:MAG: leucine--tRNA ligase [Candidatus Micrarchaeota archaeon]|nr:leucine--tRNA ligase [Candidatus Micrarchaeota archaeon]
MINYKELEEKWQKAWNGAKLFEVEPNDRKPLLVTAAFPYVNAPQHMGHIRTYGTADTYARYMRMQNYNVLYPMAFHATGTPLLAFAKRIRNNDKELIDELKMFHVPDDEIKKMTDPRYIADYFIKSTEMGMKAAGYGIDWRRKFVSIEPLFSKFVEWQFMRLKEKGHITKGKHPVGWCPNENNAVGQHDTMHDVQPEIEKITVIKFKDASSDIFFGCATFRPETIYGVTNIFVGREVKYAIAKVNGERYYISHDALYNLKHQLDVTVERDISAQELLSKKALNPVNGKEIPVLPGFFVKSDVGTGVVMSVPSHAPFDYVAIQRLKADNYPMPEFEFTKIIEIEKKGNIGIGRSLTDVSAGEAVAQHPEIPALAYLEILHANENAIDDMIEFATKLAYREESHWGIMVVEEYKGMREPEARDLITQKLQGDSKAFAIHVISNDEPVYCRCGFRVVVNIVDQWFINYGDPKWKEPARKDLKEMRIRPEKLRHTFENAMEWIDLRATERKQGLGTVFPFDNTSIIESLSDSTLYMAFYTFDHILRGEKAEPENLKPEFFDYVMLSKGDVNAVAELTGISEPALNRCRESFEYWYTNTSRHSGPDLIPNHLTMYIFNHVAILGEQYWPKQIVVNGFVDYEGEKMSKSLGNIVPILDGIEKYGADPLRFIEIAGADLDTSTEFTTENMNSVQAKNEFLYRTILSLPSIKSKEISHIDYWMYSKLNSKIKSATPMMDAINMKGAYTEIYYNSINELRKYMERSGENAMVLKEFLEKITLMLAPAMPHVAEEFWSMLGNSSFVAQEKWPEASEDMINLEEELIEEVIDNTIDDIRQGIELTGKIGGNSGKSVSEIRLIIAEQWKARAYSMLSKSKSISSVMGSIGTETDKEALSRFLGQFAKRLNTLNPREELSMESLLKAFLEARPYLEDRFRAKVTIEGEASSKSGRASRALPDKPSIDIAWG